MNELDQWFQAIHDNDLSVNNELLEFVKYILTISEKHDGTEDAFWTNAGFCNHEDWISIRNHSREYVKKKNME